MAARKVRYTYIYICCSVYLWWSNISSGTTVGRDEHGHGRYCCGLAKSGFRWNGTSFFRIQFTCFEESTLKSYRNYTRLWLWIFLEMFLIHEYVSTFILFLREWINSNMCMQYHACSHLTEQLANVRTVYWILCIS